MTTLLTESARLAEAATSTDTASGRMSIQIITPGWGSSGYYSPAVCEAAAKLVAPGTHMYFDHPSASEAIDRPERSVRDLAAIVTESARWDPKGQRLVAEAQVLAPYRELLTDGKLVEAIGLSIRGSATDIREGEAEGRRGPIIEGLASIDSIDFVTHAGRGGKVLEVLESARFIREATASDRARQLSDVVRAEYGGPGQYAWVQDQDAERNVVWFSIATETGPTRTYEQTYDVAANDVDITLTGQPTEVRRLTQYVPATRPGSNNPTTQESEEDTMPQIEEARLRELEEAAGRVTALEERATTAEAERDTARNELAEHRRATRAREVIAERAKEAGVRFTPLEERGLLATLPVGEDGTLDEAAFTTSVDEAATEVAEANGAGRVRGFGADTRLGEETDEISEADVDTAVASAFGRTQVKEA